MGTLTCLFMWCVFFCVCVTAVDDELAALKKGMLGPATVPVGALPEGRPIKDALDMELDALRKKARE